MIVAVSMAVLGLTLSAIWRGYVLMMLWAWFVVPTFNLSDLVLTQAMGLALLVSFLTYQMDADKKPEEDVAFTERVIRTLVNAALAPLLALVIGWCVHQFM